MISLLGCSRAVTRPPLPQRRGLAHRCEPRCADTRHLSILKELGVVVIPPASKLLACGDRGMWSARILQPRSNQDSLLHDPPYPHIPVLPVFCARCNSALLGRMHQTFDNACFSRRLCLQTPRSMWPFLTRRYSAKQVVAGLRVRRNVFSFEMNNLRWAHHTLLSLEGTVLNRHMIHCSLLLLLLCTVYSSCPFQIQSSG